MANFAIPNQQQYMPQMQQQPDEDLYGGAKLTPMNPLQDQLIKQILSTLSETPPIAPPPTKLSKGQRFLNAFRTDENAAKTQQNAQMADPAYRDYVQKMMAYKAHQEALQPAASLAGNLGRVDMAQQKESRIAGQAADRIEMSRWIPGSFNTINEHNVNVTMPVWKDRLTRQIYDNQGNVVDEASLPSPIHWQVAYDEFGNAIQVPNSVLPSTPSPVGKGVGTGVSAGAPGVVATPQSGGKPGQSNIAQPSNVGGPRKLGFKKTPSASLQGIQQQLDNAELALNEMKKNWLERPPGGLRQGVGTASANLLSRGFGADLGLSGVASYIDPHAVIHERDRQAIATMLSFPMTGSRRGMEGARQSLLGVIPHYTDPPEVWEAFETQVRSFIANSRRMPWGDDPDNASRMNEAAFDEFLAKVSAGPHLNTPGVNGPHSGWSLPRNVFDSLSKADQLRFTQGGGTVTEQ